MEPCPLRSLSLSLWFFSFSLCKKHRPIKWSHPLLSLSLSMIFFLFLLSTKHRPIKWSRVHSVPMCSVSPCSVSKPARGSDACVLATQPMIYVTPSCFGRIFGMASKSLPCNTSAAWIPSFIQETQFYFTAGEICLLITIAISPGVPQLWYLCMTFKQVVVNLGFTLEWK